MAAEYECIDGLFIERLSNPDEKDGKLIKKGNFQIIFQFLTISMSKLGCEVKMFVGSILLHAEFGPNDQRKDARPSIIEN